MTTSRIKLLIGAALIGGTMTIGAGAQAYWDAPLGGPWSDPGWGGGPWSEPGYPYSGYGPARDRTHARQREMRDHRAATQSVARMLSGQRRFDRAKAIGLAREIEASAGERHGAVVPARRFAKEPPFQSKDRRGNGDVQDAGRGPESGGRRTGRRIGRTAGCRRYQGRPCLVAGLGNGCSLQSPENCGRSGDTASVRCLHEAARHLPRLPCEFPFSLALVETDGRRSPADAAGSFLVRASVPRPRQITTSEERLRDA